MITDERGSNRHGRQAPTGHRRRWLLTVPALLTSAALATGGCAATVHGSASKAGANVKASSVNPGNYPTTPRTDLGKAGPKGGPLVDARRMGSFIVQPFEVDPQLTQLESNVPVGPFAKVDAAAKILGLVFPEAAGRNYVNQFWSSRFNGDAKVDLYIGILRYRTPEDANAAVAELGANGGPDFAQLRYAETKPDSSPIPIPRHDESRALTWKDANRANVVSYTPHGPYMFMVFSSSGADAGVGTTLIANTLDRQAPLIDKFTPTPVDGLADLPLDPDGILARTLEPPVGSEGTTDYRYKHGLYGSAGFLTFSDNPAGDQKLLADNGVDAVALSGADVYRARDKAAATQIVEAWAQSMLKNEWESIDPPQGLPDSRCARRIDNPDTEFTMVFYDCLVVADRYVVQVGSPQKPDAYQMAAAQFLLLTSS